MCVRSVNSYWKFQFSLYHVSRSIKYWFYSLKVLLSGFEVEYRKRYRDENVLATERNFDMKKFLMQLKEVM